MILPRVERFRVLKLLRTEEIDEHRGGERVHKLATKEERAVRNRWRRKSRYYRRRNITQKIASVTPSSLVNYRELPIIIRSVKVFTIVLGRAGLGTMMQSLDGPTLSVNPPRCNLQFRNLRFLRVYRGFYLTHRFVASRLIVVLVNLKFRSSNWN